MSLSEKWLGIEELTSLHLNWIIIATIGKAPNILPGEKSICANGQTNSFSGRHIKYCDAH